MNVFTKVVFVYIVHTAKRDCKLSHIAREYMGSINITASGKVCRRWDELNEKQWSKFMVFFPEENITLAENFCRNPMGTPLGPWCFTGDRNYDWGYCKIHFCGCEYTNKKFLW